MVRFFAKYSSSSVESLLDRLQKQLNAPPKEMLRKIGALYLNATEERILTKEKGPQGQVWQPLSPVTVSKKAKGLKGRGRALMSPSKRLVWTGKLSSSLHVRIEGNEVFVGTKGVEYARTMQYGAKRGQFAGFRFKNSKTFRPIPWGTIPPRPYLGFDLATNEKVRRMLIKELGDTLKLGPKWARDL